MTNKWFVTEHHFHVPLIAKNDPLGSASTPAFAPPALWAQKKRKVKSWNLKIMAKTELENRSKKFALAIIDLVERLPRNRAGDVVGRQLLRSGTSIGANYIGLWNMIYVYVLQSTKDKFLYTGCTTDLKKRFASHNKGQVPATVGRQPFTLIYYEACISKYDAFRREKYLKTTYGKRYIRNRCKVYFTG